LKLELPDIKCNNLGKSLLDASIDYQRELPDRNGDFNCYCKDNIEIIKDNNFPKFPDG
jgi:hypothetical protein